MTMQRVQTGMEAINSRAEAAHLRVDEALERMRRNEDSVVESQADLMQKLTTQQQQVSGQVMIKLESLETTALNTRSANERLESQITRVIDELTIVKQNTQATERALLTCRGECEELNSAMRHLQTREQDRMLRQTEGEGVSGFALTGLRSEISEIHNKVRVVEDRLLREGSSTDSRMSRLADCIAGLENKVATTSTALASTTSKVDGLQSTLGRFEETISGIESAAMRAYTDLTEKTESMHGGHRRDIMDLKKELTSVVTSLGERVGAFEAATNERATSVNEALRSIVKEHQNDQVKWSEFVRYLTLASL